MMGPGLNAAAPAFEPDSRRSQEGSHGGALLPVAGLETESAAELTGGCYPQTSPALTLQELFRYIRTLPTKADLDAIFSRWAVGFQKELDETRVEVQTLRATVLEQATQHAALQQQFSALERKVKTQSSQFFLHVDDLENRSRRNNIKIRGLPETTADVALKGAVLAIFNSLLNRPSTATIELDRVHRLFTPDRGADIQAPRDVLCRVHFYSVKAAIMRRVRDRGRVLFDGAELTLLPDLSRRTLAMRRAVRPLLNSIKVAGGTYYWGYPFSLMIRKGSHTFSLMDPAQLPEAFQFLQVNPIAVPDWLSAAPANIGPPPLREGYRSCPSQQPHGIPNRSGANSVMGTPSAPA